MAPRLLRHVLAAGLAAIVMAAGDGAAAAEKVDLALVLAVDVSGSMDPEEQEVQRQGYMEAITHPEIVAAIRSGPNRRIAMTYIEWSGYTQQVIIPWTIVGDQASANAFASILGETPYSRRHGTSISGALDFSSRQIENSGLDALRRVIDVSGDGPNNAGAPLGPTHEQVLAKGIVINGLPILIRPSMYGGPGGPTLEDYYRECVIGGAGSFVIPITTREEFAPAIRRKLVLEISGLPPRIVPASMVVAQDQPKMDCNYDGGAFRFWDQR